jgi:hypothetical protein
MIKQAIPDDMLYWLNKKDIRMLDVLDYESFIFHALVKITSQVSPCLYTKSYLKPCYINPCCFWDKYRPNGKNQCIFRTDCINYTRVIPPSLRSVE